MFRSRSVYCITLSVQPKLTHHIFYVYFMSTVNSPHPWIKHWYTAVRYLHSHILPQRILSLVLISQLGVNLTVTLTSEHAWHHFPNLENVSKCSLHSFLRLKTCSIRWHVATFSNSSLIIIPRRRKLSLQIILWTVDSRLLDQNKE